jgi:hypothetical protein
MLRPFDQVFSARGGTLEALRARVTHSRAGEAEVSCAEVALVLPSILDGDYSADEAVISHVGSCLRCQSELARYRKLLRLLNQLRAYRVEPPVGVVADVLGVLEDAAQRRVIRSALTGRRIAYAGAFVVPAALIVAVALSRRGRLRRVRPVVLS